MASHSNSASASTSAILAYGHPRATPVNELFTRKELVGKGAYGGVYKGVHNPTGTVVALKVIDLDTPDDDISEIQKEVQLLSELRDAARHNITLYHGSYLSGYELWIAMDFASGGSIRTLMKSGPIEEKYAALIVREVLVALSFLHRQDIIHRDVKAANILLTQTGKILLCDFGVAAHLQTNSKRSTFTGTPLWMAPEVITDGKLYDTKADVWSLGITLYEIIVGNPPHFGMEPLRACAIIPRSEPPTLPEDAIEPGGRVQDGEPSQNSPAMKEFLANCLRVDPTLRPTADELSRTKWIKSAAKLPMVLLRELIVRYVSWIQSGGQRTSIVGTLPGMEGGGDLVQREDTFELAGAREEGWDFDVEEHDFGVLGVLAGRGGGGDSATSLGLGDEPNYKTLDELAATGNLRRPKPTTTAPPPPPNRNHPLLRLFDEESNPYAQQQQPLYLQQQQQFSGATPLISLPASSLNTLKPTISLPSFDDDTNDDGSVDRIGISLPSFDYSNSSSSSSGFFGASSTGAGWGGAGWGSAAALSATNDAFGFGGGGGSVAYSSPFDTIGTGRGGGGGGGGGGGDETPLATVRSNPFNQPPTSWDYSSSSTSLSSSSPDGFGLERVARTARDEEEWYRGSREAEDDPHVHDQNDVATVGKDRGNGFKFGAAGRTSGPNDSTSSSLANRRRADTAPSFRPTPTPMGSADMGIGGNGGYPPLGPGLTRPPEDSGGGGGGGGYPPLGAGLARIPVFEQDEAVTDPPIEGLNRPFGGGGGGSARPFQFGATAQQRERAATLSSPAASGSEHMNLNRPFRFGAGAGGGAAETKRPALTTTPAAAIAPAPLHQRQASSISLTAVAAPVAAARPGSRQRAAPSHHHHHQPNQLSTSSSTSTSTSSSSSSSSSTSTLLLTASPTSSISLGGSLGGDRRGGGGPVSTSSSDARAAARPPRENDEDDADADVDVESEDPPTPLAVVEARPPPPPSANVFGDNENYDDEDNDEGESKRSFNATATTKTTDPNPIGFPFPRSTSSSSAAEGQKEEDEEGLEREEPSKSDINSNNNDNDDDVDDQDGQEAAEGPRRSPGLTRHRRRKEGRRTITTRRRVQVVVPLPTVPSLVNYRDLTSSIETVERQLEVVLDALTEWFEVVENGLETVLRDDGLGQQRHRRRRRRRRGEADEEGGGGDDDDDDDDDDDVDEGEEDEEEGEEEEDEEEEEEDDEEDVDGQGEGEEEEGEDEDGEEDDHDGYEDDGEDDDAKDEEGEGPGGEARNEQGRKKPSRRQRRRRRGGTTDILARKGNMGAAAATAERPEFTWIAGLDLRETSPSSSL